MKMRITQVMYDGTSASVVRNGANANPYYFAPKRWITINQHDRLEYLKRCERNAAWNIRENDEVATNWISFVRFMGFGSKFKKDEKATSIKRVDEFPDGTDNKESTREYEFPMEEWVEIHDNDKAFFKLKADCNEHWEYEKRLIPIVEKLSKKEQKAAEKAAKLAEAAE